MEHAVAFPLPLCSFQGSEDSRGRKATYGLPTTTNIYINLARYLSTNPRAQTARKTRRQSATCCNDDLLRNPRNPEG